VDVLKGAARMQLGLRSSDGRGLSSLCGVDERLDSFITVFLSFCAVLGCERY
jgi:hypothetical protein